MCITTLLGHPVAYRDACGLQRYGRWHCVSQGRFLFVVVVGWGASKAVQLFFCERVVYEQNRMAIMTFIFQTYDAL